MKKELAIPFGLFASSPYWFEAILFDYTSILHVQQKMSILIMTTINMDVIKVF